MDLLKKERNRLEEAPFQKAHRPINKKSIVNAKEGLQAYPIALWPAKIQAKLFEDRDSWTRQIRITCGDNWED